MREKRNNDNESLSKTTEHTRKTKPTDKKHKFLNLVY